jgi:26S proteasome regulatory subunit N10
MKRVPRSTMVIIDNSSSTMNSDFYPNRLEAQLKCAERLAENLKSVDESSQLGIITASPPEDGIRSSLTPSIKSIINSCQAISRGKEPINIDKAIKRSIMALRHGTTPEMKKKILLFVASDANISDDSIAQIQKLLTDNQVTLDIVIIGSHVSNLAQLQKLNSFQAPNAIFLLIETGAPASIADFVLATSIGVLSEPIPKINTKLQKQDPELYNALVESQNRPKPEWIQKEFENVAFYDNIPQPKKSRKSKKAANSYMTNSTEPQNDKKEKTDDANPEQKSAKPKRKRKTKKDS